MPHHQPPEPPCTDFVQPFHASGISASGRLVRLGPVLDEILTRHAYPEPVSFVLAEAVVLTALLGSALNRPGGRFILQTSSDGPVHMVVCDYSSTGQLRAYAGFDAEKLMAFAAPDASDAPDTPEATGGTVSLARRARLIGAGHMAMTIDADNAAERYQGVIALEGNGLLAAARHYFVTSEQLPTRLHLAIARHYDNSARDVERGWGWRAGGLILQHVPDYGGKAAAHRQPIIMPAADDPAEEYPEDPPEDHWQRAQFLTETIEDHELLDNGLAPERLLYRLYHEEQVRVHPRHDLSAACRCSRTRIARVLQSFPADEINDMLDEGRVSVTCEFCNTHYQFHRDDLIAG